MLRKEAQCRDLQQRLENGEGSKFICVYAIKKIPEFRIFQKLLTLLKRALEIMV